MNTRTKNRLLNELEPIDITILNYLKLGLTQSEISGTLKNSGIKPNSTSIIEKRLKSIREKFSAYTNFHLAVILFGK